MRRLYVDMARLRIMLCIREMKMAGTSNFSDLRGRRLQANNQRRPHLLLILNSYKHAVDKSVVYALLFSHILIFCPYFSLISESTIKFGMVIYLSIISVYLVKALLSGRNALAAVAMIFIIALLFYQQSVFSARYRIPVNLNATIPYLAIGAYLVFMQLRLNLNQKISTIFNVCLIYSIVYIASALIFVNYNFAAVDGVIEAGQASGDSRSNRLICALMYVSAGTAICWSRIVTGLHSSYRLVTNLLLLTPFLGALYLAQSRMITLFLILSIVTVTFIRFKGVGAIRSLIALSVCGFFLVSVAVGFNIYSPIKGLDLSSRARYLVFDTAHEIITERPLTALGISIGAGGPVEKVDDPYSPSKLNRKIGLYASDVAFIGWWLQFGLIGTAILVFSIPYCVNGRLDEFASRSTVLSCRILGFLIPFYAPSNVGGSGTMLFAFIISEHLLARRSRMAALSLGAANRNALSSKENPADERGV